jgi:hypothetical protein
MPAYRIKGSLTAVILCGASERFQCLNCGTILIPLSEPNAAGMIDARCEGNLIRVFERDLSEQSECIGIERRSGIQAATSIGANFSSYDY